jgi:hypothetical protein
MFSLFRRRSRSPLDKPCSVCGGISQYGYSDQAESDNLASMCLPCLRAQLERDYGSFQGRAVVVQPAPGPPVYVFQPSVEWAKSFPETRIADDVRRLLDSMPTTCGHCGTPSRFVWVESRGLTGHNFGYVLDRGISEALLRENPAPLSHCAQCCVARITQTLQSRNISYLEVCSPRGAGFGFVLPMGY